MYKYTDVEIWDLCLSGAENAFEELYKRYYALLHNYGCKFTSNREVVHDTIQDLFIKLITNHRKLSKTPHPKGYLLKAYKNNLLDAIQKEGLYIQTPFTENLINNLDKTNNKEDDTDHIIVMRRSYHELSEKQKEVIYLFYVKNLSHEEISAILGINYQSSKNLLSRSLSILRKKFVKKLKIY